MTTFYDDPQNTHNPATSTAIPATWGDKVRDNQEFFAAPPSCKAYTSTPLSMAGTGAWITVTMDAEYWDSDSFHSTSSNTSRLTIPSGFDGKYLVTCVVTIASSATGIRGARLLVNGTTGYAASTHPAATSSISAYVHTSDIIDLAAGDYVEPQGFQTSGGNLDSYATVSCLWVSL